MTFNLHSGQRARHGTFVPVSAAAALSHEVALELCQLAQRSTELALYRSAALALIGKCVPFEAALFHELSPRIPLSRGAILGIELAALDAGRRGWDDNAVLFARLRELALANEGVATDRAAFARDARVSAAWRERVCKPLSIRSAMIGHLIVQERIISVLLLCRRSRAAFSGRDESALKALLPALAIGDALQQTLADRAQPLTGPPTELRCTDQRLTARQRELVERVALGHTNAQIAAALGLSEHTVRNLLTATRQRIGAANRAELVRLAVLR
jgi:DNA-binding CsgD family transcriptional regulator